MRRMTWLIASGVFALGMAGCAATTTQAPTAQGEVSAGEAQLALRAQQPQQIGNGALPMPDMQGNASELPPGAKPGECYARVVIPAKYATKSQRVLKREASERIEVVPPKYGSVQEQVLVKEASTRLETMPPVYETVEEQIMVRPPSKKIVEVPATYRTVTEKILVKPAHTVWKKGTGLGVGAGTHASAAQVAAFVERHGGKVVDTRVEDTGEILCLVEVPAEYRAVTREVVDTPAATKTVEIPPEYKTVQKRVLKQPAQTREVIIPAEYKTVKVTREIEPAAERRVSIPEEWETVTVREQLAHERVEWRPVLCEVNMTPAVVSSLQNRLRQAGCSKCGVDGVMGQCTLDAMRCYCEPRGLPWGNNYVTTQCVHDLGVKI